MCWKCQFGGGSLVAGGKNPCQGIETWQVTAFCSLALQIGSLAGNCGMLCWASNQVSSLPCSAGALADRAPKFVLQTGLCWNFCLNSLVCSSVLVQLVADWIGNFATSRSVVWQPCLGSLAVLSWQEVVVCNLALQFSRLLGRLAVGCACSGALQFGFCSLICSLADLAASGKPAVLKLWQVGKVGKGCSFATLQCWSPCRLAILQPCQGPAV